jgi:mannose-6-phosphate isomerase-like protein (cupin superfamily)
MDEQVLGLVAAMRQFLLGLDDGLLAPFLALWPGGGAVDKRPLPTTLPVLTHLPQSVTAANGVTRPLVEVVVKTAVFLAWGQTYTAADFGADFLANYGWTELIGLRGPLASEQLACGFLLLGPTVEYPLHRHEAEEVYVPLTGNGRWQWGSEGWQVRPAGDIIYHAPWQPHAMQTGAEPLLALYLWRGGDLVQKSDRVTAGK